jgi:outer membrane lipopolysaccharide assembly protein LptE/RlpB
MRRKHGGGQADGKDSVSLARVSTTGYGVARGSRFKSRFRSVRATRFSVLVLLFCTACGYHTAGHVVAVAPGIQTIAIPAFKNDSNTYRIEQMLTAAVVNEFTTRTRYQILHEPSGDADATLQGTVLSTSATPLAYDTNTGRAASVLVVVSISVKLTDRHGKVLYQNPQYLFREQYELSQDVTTFFQEDSPALHRLSRDFGRTLVSNLLEGF